MKKERWETNCGANSSNPQEYENKQTKRQQTSWQYLSQLHAQHLMCLFICLYTFIVLSRCVPTIHQVCMRTHAAETKYFHCRFALRCTTEECDAPQNTGGAIHHHCLVNNSAKRCVIYRANKSNCDLYRKSNAAHTLTQKSNFPFVFAFFPVIHSYCAHSKWFWRLYGYCHYCCCCYRCRRIVSGVQSNLTTRYLILSFNTCKQTH